MKLKDYEIPAAREQPHEQSFQVALEPCDVQFGPHFSLQQPLYLQASPSQSWKMPRWVVTMVGLFFGSAAVLTLAICVMLLRDPNPPTAESAVPSPTAPVAAAMNKAPADVPRAPSAPAQQTTAAVRHPGPATANPAHAHRIVVSRHASIVHRQIHRSRRVASNRTPSSIAPQQAEASGSRPPKDALDQLLSESSL